MQLDLTKYFLKDHSQPLPFSMPLKLLIFACDCFTVSCVTESVGTVIILISFRVISFSVLCSEFNMIFNQVPRLSGRRVPGIPRGFHCGQPAPR